MTIFRPTSLQTLKVAWAVPLLVSLLSSTSPASNVFTRWIDSVHTRADQSAAKALGPTCKLRAGESIAQLEAREARLFEDAATRLSDLDKCDVIRLHNLEKGGYRSPFITAVVKDIAIKLPTLRPLYKEIEKQKATIKELEKQNNAYDSQIARFGPLSASDEKARAELSKKIEQVKAALTKPTLAYKALFGTIWRNQDGAMAKYMKALLRSSLSAQDFSAQALQPSPTLVVSLARGNFSFFDQVLKPMIANETLFIKKIKAQYVATPAGLKFQPNFETRQNLANNLDLLYDPAPQTDDYKELVCDIDQKYISGDEDLDLTITGGSLLIGPFGKVLPWTLRLIRLEGLIEGSVAVTRAGQILNSVPSAYWSFRTAGSAISACQSNYKRLQKDNNACQADSTVEEADDFDARELDQENCGLLLFSTAMNKTGIGVFGELSSKAFASNPDLLSYIEQAQKVTTQAIDLKNQGQSVIGNVGTAKDFAGKVVKIPDSPNAQGKDDDDDDSSSP